MDCSLTPIMQKWQLSNKLWISSSEQIKGSAPIHNRQMSCETPCQKILWIQIPAKLYICIQSFLSCSSHFVLLSLPSLSASPSDRQVFTLKALCRPSQAVPEPGSDSFCSLLFLFCHWNLNWEIQSRDCVWKNTSASGCYAYNWQHRIIVNQG